MAQRLKTDWILFGTVLAAGVVRPADSLQRFVDHGAARPALSDSSWHFVIRQLEWAVVAVVVMMAAEEDRLPQVSTTPAVAFGAIGVCLMLLVAVYFVDTAHHRWLRLGGPVGVQPSELAKPALVIFLAFFVTWRGARHQQRPATRWCRRRWRWGW